MTDGMNNKDEKGKLDFMESLIQEAREERMRANNSESEQIFSDNIDEEKKGNKKIENREEEDRFDYYYSSEEESSSGKQILIGLFGVGAIGLMGYFGLNYLQDDKTPTQNSAIVATDKVKETASTEQKKEEVSIATTESSALKSTKEESKIKETQSIASSKPSTTSDAKTTDEDTKMIASIIQSLHKKEDSSKDSNEEIDKVETPVKIANTETENKSVKNEVKERVVTKEKKPKKVVKNVIKKNVVAKKEKPKKLKPRIVTVRKGDTLASISKRFYGNPMHFDRIVRANRNIRSASSSLRLGQKIIVPRVQKSSTKKRTANVKKRRFIRVRKGDTLAILAKRYYGNSNKFYKIVNANYKIKNASTRLHIGQRLYIPR